MDNSHGFGGLKLAVKNNWNTLAWIVIAVLLTLQIKSCLTKTPENADLVRSEEKIKALEEKRLSDSLATAAYINLKDETIDELRNKEAVIVNQYIQSNDKLKNIPAIVNALVKDSLRAAFQRHDLLPD